MDWCNLLGWFLLVGGLLQFFGIFWVDFFVGGLVQSLGLFFLVGGLLQFFGIFWVDFFVGGLVQSLGLGFVGWWIVVILKYCSIFLWRMEGRFD